jgi:hypothetical protein
MKWVVSFSISSAFLSHAGLAKMGLVDPSLRKKEHGPKAVAKKAQRLYNSVVHGVPDKKVEQQETSNMTQSATQRLLCRLDAIDARRLHLLMTWVVASSILSQFIRVGAVVAARRRERGRVDGVDAAAGELMRLVRVVVASMASSRDRAASTTSS